MTAALCGAGLASFAAMYCSQALLPALSAHYRIGPATAALTVSLTTGALALSIIPASVLSERYGRIRVMLISGVASSVIGLLLPFSPSLGVLLFGRAAQGVALAGIPAVAMALLAEEVDASSLGSAMGRYIAGTTIGGLAGRIVPSVVVQVGTCGWPCWRAPSSRWPARRCSRCWCRGPGSSPRSRPACAPPCATSPGICETRCWPSFLRWALC